MAKAGYGTNQINPGLLLVEKIYNYTRKFGFKTKVSGARGGAAAHWSRLVFAATGAPPPLCATPITLTPQPASPALRR